MSLRFLMSPDYPTAMPRKKIAHIITHLELGGAQKTTLSLFKRINKKDYEPHLITSAEGLLVEDAISLTDVKVVFIPTLTRNINPLKDLISFLRISAYLKRQRISLVHTHSPKAGIIGRWAAKCAGARQIFHTVHGWPFYIETSRLMRLVYILLEKITSWITTSIIVVSDADLATGLRFVNKDIKKYIKISYGIESKQFLCIGEKAKDSQQLKALNIKKDICIVGFISCFKPQKAPIDFVKVAKAVIDKKPDIEFISAGDGALRHDAEMLSLKLGLDGKIKFLGWQRDIVSIYSVIDILVLTSLWEGLPLVFLEAMACGIPVVATDVGGAPETIKNGVNGFLEKPHDYKKIAQDILFLAENPERRKIFQDHMKKSFRPEFDISYMTAQIENLYAAYNK